MHMVTERQPIAELWVGADFAMGRGRKGSIAVLAELGAASGWDLHMVAAADARRSGGEQHRRSGRCWPRAPSAAPPTSSAALPRPGRGRGRQPAGRHPPRAAEDGYQLRGPVLTSQRRLRRRGGCGVDPAARSRWSRAIPTNRARPKFDFVRRAD